MITVTKTDSGGYNVIGTNDMGFCISGHLNEDELLILEQKLMNHCLAIKRRRAKTTKTKTKTKA